MLKRVLRLTNRRARLLVGLLLAGLFCVQCTQTEADPKSTVVTAYDGLFVGTDPDRRKTVDELARTDHVALLEMCLKNYDAVYRNYTCTLIKQERIRGVLGQEQWIDVKFMESPYSVAMKWTKNPAGGDRVLYVEGKWDNQMLVRPFPPWKRVFVATARRKPDGRDAMENTLRPVNMFGFKRGMKSLVDVYKQARAEGDSTEQFGNYYKVNGRETVVLVRYLPAKNDYPAWETKVYIDLEYLVPILIEGLNWDKQLSCRYAYRDVRFNVKLGADAFGPEANDLKPPK